MTGSGSMPALATADVDAIAAAIDGVPCGGRAARGRDSGGCYVPSWTPGGRCPGRGPSACSCRSCSPPVPPCGCWRRRCAAGWHRTSGVAGSTCTWPTFKPRGIIREERDADACAPRVGGGTSPSAAGTDPCPPPRQGWGRCRVHPAPPSPRPGASLERDLSRDEVRPPAPLVAGVVPSIPPFRRTSRRPRRVV